MADRYEITLEFNDKSAFVACAEKHSRGVLKEGRITKSNNAAWKAMEHLFEIQ